ncbi:MAG: sigma-70 family RNA polymerase sigma factor [Pseudomonadota bacterium]
MLGRLCRSREFRLKLENSRGRLYRLAYSWCHTPELAEDLVQETMSKALKQGAQLKALESMDGWLFRILSNCWCDHMRAQRETQVYDEEQHQHQLTPEVLSLRQQDIDNVRRAVASLPEGQRQVITLVDIEGCRYAEVAEILGVPIGTVMSRLCRARHALKEQLIAGGPVQERQILSFRRQS